MRWSEPLSWEDGQTPGVAAVDKSVALFHPHCVGFGPDLPRVLASAGGKVRKEDRGVPVVEVSLELPAGAAGAKLQREFEVLFAQRDQQSNVARWKVPWRGGLWGEADDASLVIEGRRCTFTLPMDPGWVSKMRGYLEGRKSGKLSIRLATAKELAAVQAREAALTAPAAAAPAKGGGKAAKGAPVKATAVKPAAAAAIRKEMPEATVVIPDEGERFDAESMASGGDRLYALGYDTIFAGTGDGPMVKLADAPKAKGVFADDAEIWTCGVDVRRSTDGGKSWKKVVTPPEPGLASVYGWMTKGAMDEGAAWVAGCEGTLMVSRGGKPFEAFSGLKDTVVYAVVPSIHGVLAVTHVGHVVVVRDGKLVQTPLKAKSPLHDVCVTPQGTIVAVGLGEFKGAVFRSTDGGKSFSPGKPAHKAAIRCVAVLPDGRIVTGGDNGTIGVSVDDGKTFKPLPSPVSGPRLKSAVVHRGAVYLGGRVVVRIA